MSKFKWVIREGKETFFFFANVCWLPDRSLGSTWLPMPTTDELHQRDLLPRFEPGNARQDVLHSGDDHQRFIEPMQEVCARVSMRVLAWRVMWNHCHLVVLPHADGEGSCSIRK